MENRSKPHGFESDRAAGDGLTKERCRRWIMGSSRITLLREGGERAAGEKGGGKVGHPAARRPNRQDELRCLCLFQP